MFYHLAQVSDIFQAQQDTVVAIRETVESVQADLLQSQIFFWASAVSMGLAVALIGFYAITTIQQFEKSRNPRPLLYGAIYVMIIITAIANAGTGSNIGRTSFVLGQGTNRMAEAPIAIISRASGTGNIVEESGAQSAIRSVRGQDIQACLAQYPDKGEDRDQCLVDVITSVEQALEPYVALGGGANTNDAAFELNPWPTALLSETRDLVFPYFEDPNTYTTSNFGERAFGDVGRTITGIGVAGWLFVIGSLFTYLAGITQTVLMVVAPLMAVLSFAPVFRDSLASWFKNFIGISVSRLIFNLMAATAAYINLSAQSADPIIFPTIIALMSAVFSLILLNGAGSQLLGAQARVAASIPLGLAATRSLFRTI